MNDMSLLLAKLKFEISNSNNLLQSLNVPVVYSTFSVLKFLCLNF